MTAPVFIVPLGYPHGGVLRYCRLLTIGVERHATACLASIPTDEPVLITAARPADSELCSACREDLRVREPRGEDLTPWRQGHERKIWESGWSGRASIVGATLWPSRAPYCGPALLAGLMLGGGGVLGDWHLWKRDSVVAAWREAGNRVQWQSPGTAPAEGSR